MKQHKFFTIVLVVSLMMGVACPLLAETKPLVELELKLLQMQESSYDKAIKLYEYTLIFLLTVTLALVALKFIDHTKVKKFIDDYDKKRQAELAELDQKIANVEAKRKEVELNLKMVMALSQDTPQDKIEELFDLLQEETNNAFKAMVYFNIASTVPDANKQLEYITIAMALDSSNYLFYSFKGYLFCEREKYEDALRSFNQAISLNPNYANAYNGKGVALSTLEKYDEAIESLNQGISLNPYLSDLYSNKSYALLELKDYNQVITLCNQAIQLDSTNIVAFTNKICAMHYLKRYDEALECAKTALQYAMTDLEKTMVNNLLEKIKKAQQSNNP